MSKADTSLLRELASKAAKSGDRQLALQHYLELERLEQQPVWAKHAALILQQLGRIPEAVAALNRAADGYAAAGDLIKATLASNQVLRLDPRNAETRLRVAELGLEPSEPPRPAAPQPGVAPPRPAPRPSSPGEPAGVLGGLQLNQLVPSGPGKPRASSFPGIHQIRLPNEAKDDEPLELHISDEEESSQDITVDAAGNLVGSRPPRAPAKAGADPIAALEDEVRVAKIANAAMMRTPFFSALGPKSLGELLMNARVVELEQGKELFHQGDRGDALYVVADGEIDLYEESSPRRMLARLGEGEFFGEVALIADQPRNATAQAAGDATLIAIDSDVVLARIHRDSNFLPLLLMFLRDRLVERFIKSNPLFRELSPSEQAALKPRFHFLEIDPGTTLFEQGKKPDGLMILLAGRVEATRVHEGRVVPLGERVGGDVLGEIALVGQAFPQQGLASRLRGSTAKDSVEGVPSVSISTLRTVTRCFALELSAEDFTKVVRGPGMAFIRRVIEQRATQVRAILSGAAPYSEGRLQL